MKTVGVVGSAEYHPLQLNVRSRRSAGVLARRREGLKCADSGRSRDHDRTTGGDPKRPVDPAFAQSLTKPKRKSDKVARGTSFLVIHQVKTPMASWRYITPRSLTKRSLRRQYVSVCICEACICEAGYTFARHG